MPKRNFILLLAICLTCLAAYMAREQSAAGRRFGEVLDLVETSYLDRADERELFDTAVDAALSKLDEHSAYIRGDERADLEAVLDQKFGGVGLELTIDEASREPIVASPVIDSPAWRAGIHAGDRIETIDGAATAGVPLREIVTSLRGAVGDRVVLQIAAPAADPPTTLDPGVDGQHLVARRDVTLVRELIKTESVQGDRRGPDGRWEWMIEGVPGVALVRITTFGERTAEELSAAADAIAETGDPQGIVIDLRGNPGGLLSAAIDVCDLFLDDGVIVHTRGRKAAAPGEDAAIETRRAAAGAKLAGVPMMVLVDGLTASAAEIVAACLQDTGRATLVGSRTFGKGTVQSILPLSDDRGLLKLTTSEYLRPSRANIHRRAGDGDDEPWGVSPDAGYEITPTAESNSRLAIWRRSRDAAGPVPANRVSGGLPRDLDPVLARGLEGLSARGPIAGEPDLRSEKETSRDDDDPAGPDA